MREVYMTHNLDPSVRSRLISSGLMSENLELTQDVALYVVQLFRCLQDSARTCQDADKAKDHQITLLARNSCSVIVC